LARSEGMTESEITCLVQAEFVDSFCYANPRVAKSLLNSFIPTFVNQNLLFNLELKTS